MNTTRPTLRGGNSRLNFLLWLVPLCMFFAGAAAQTTYTRLNARVARLQADPTYDSTGTVTAVPMEYYILLRSQNGANTADTEEKPWVKVSVDLLDAARAGDTITAAGKTVSPPQLAALLRQYGLDRANAAGVQ